MNINKALEHFEWKFKNSWKPTQRDIEAFNAIIEYKEVQNSYNMSKNESLAKLWIHQLILLANSNMYTGQRCIQVLDEILSKSVYSWCIKLKNELPVMRFNSVDDDKLKALTSEVKEEHVIKFVEDHVSRVINKFEK